MIYESTQNHRSLASTFSCHQLLITFHFKMKFCKRQRYSRFVHQLLVHYSKIHHQIHIKFALAKLTSMHSLSSLSESEVPILNFNRCVDRWNYVRDTGYFMYYVDSIAPFARHNNFDVLWFIFHATACDDRSIISFIDASDFYIFFRSRILFSFNKLRSNTKIILSTQIISQRKLLQKFIIYFKSM